MDRTLEDIAEETASNLEKLTNCMGSKENLNTVMNRMLHCHRTINQQFTGSFIVNFIRIMAIRYKNRDFDGRNEFACKMCDSMWEGLKKEYPNYFKDDMTTEFALI